VDTSVRASNESPNSLALLFVTREIFSGSTEASKCSLILIHRCYVVLENFMFNNLRTLMVTLENISPANSLM